MKASVYLSTLGCRLNEAELVSWSSAFAAQGHQLVSRPQDANLIVLNTCAVTAEASRKSRKHASALHRKSPSARIVITGCMAELEPDKAAALSGVDLVLTNKQKDNLVDEVLRAIDLELMPALAMAPDGHHVHAEAQTVDAPAGATLVTLGKSSQERTRAFIKVQDGCRNQCSYCVVTIARGEERSRGIAALIAEVNGLHQQGYQEAVLTGVHLGGYGHDLGTNLSELVRGLLAGTTIPRLRLSSLEPWDLPEDFGQLWQDPRLMPHLHLPLQSGSDSVLRRMARRCFRKDYRALVQRLRSEIPELNLTTDLIVGFPGESEEEFAESLTFAEEMRFGHMHIFGYSAREGTKAAKLAGRVEGPVIRERSRRMHRLAAQMKEEAMRHFLGSRRSVLWEAGSPDAEGQVLYQGYTDNYLRVQTSVPAEQKLQSTISDVLLSTMLNAPADRFEASLV